jgi:hypothetical protein
LKTISFWLYSSFLYKISPALTVSQFLLQVIVEFYGSFNRTLARLHTTSQRLGAAAASTNVYAGYKISITHGTFRGVTAAVAPNRKLYAGIVVINT